MTAIVGIVHEGKTWIGADSMVSDDETRAPTMTRKLWRAGGYLIGAAGNSAWYAILRRMRWPTIASPGYPIAPIFADMTNAANELGLHLPAAKGDSTDGSMLIGGCGKLFYVDSDLGVDEYECMAAGSGDECCRAVLHAFPTGSPRSRILRALSAASAIRFDVGPPFYVESV